MNIYNEIEPYPAQWMRKLAAAGHIVNGRVDERSISDLVSSDLDGALQAHFFAGIGGWSYALRLAGWRDEWGVWTGSCPCQPFSGAGKRAGFADKRHLWPEWFRLIRECRPAIIFGEQVASPDGLQWLDLVSSDLEGAGYSFAASDLCAAGIFAPHLRQRLYFVGYSNARDIQRYDREQYRTQDCVRYEADNYDAPPSSGIGTLANNNTGSQRWIVGRDSAEQLLTWKGSLASTLANNNNNRCEGFPIKRFGLPTNGNTSPWNDVNGCSTVDYSKAEWIYCTDEKYRPIESGTFPLANGIPERVGRLRAYGNAIHTHVAATFIRAVMQCL